jgi:hypothetical protein
VPPEIWSVDAMKTIARLAALAAAAGLAAAFWAGPATASVAPAPARPAVPALAWKPCDEGFRCATALAPLDYHDPRAAQVSIAVISRRATGPRSALGWLFVNGGGPNPQVSGLPTAYPQIPAAWRERYNIITFDPRGMGYSTQVRCFPTEAAEEKLLGNLPVFPVGKAQQEGYHRAYAKLDARCDLRQPVPGHDRPHDPRRQPQPRRLERREQPGARLRSARLAAGLAGGDDRVPRPVR